MFRKEFFFLPLAIMVLSSPSIAQSTTSASPSPTPKPATRRPTLDQFGLSNGVFANKESTASTANAEPPVSKVEYVDQGTFDTIRQMIETSEFMEVELLYLLSNSANISPGSAFAKEFQRSIVINTTVGEACDGSFSGESIKSGELTKLLQQNEKIASEIVAVLDAGSEEYARFSKELNGVAEKFGVPLLENSSAGTRLNRPALLKAMMAKINANYARVKKQMAVRK
jgi:hypothetical protein